VASGVAKPDGLLRVDPDAELAFLHPLPVRRLWGVGKVTAEKLHVLGITTVGELADLGAPALVSALGPAAGHHLYALATGVDGRRVEHTPRRRSIGSQRALGRRPPGKERTAEELDALLAGTLDRLGKRLRAGHRVSRTVVLRLRFADFSRITRSHTVSVPTAHTETLLEAARGLLTGVLPLIYDRGLTLLGVSLANLDDDTSEQLALPFDAASGPALDTTLDDLRTRFGARSVTRGTQLRIAPGIDMPMLPDDVEEAGERRRKRAPEPVDVGEEEIVDEF
jgi:DNA polymerase IV